MKPLGVRDITRKEKIEHDGKTILEINLCAPLFECESKREGDRLNGYYEEALDGFYGFCKNKFSKTLLQKKCCRKGGAVMKWYIPFANDSAMSVIVEASLYDGKTRLSERFISNWLLDGCVPLRSDDAFSVSRKAVRGYIEAIQSKIEKREGGFSYYKNASSLALRAFRKDNFYLTPNGVAFYYPRGVLTDKSEKAPVFVIPYESISGMKFASVNIGVPLLK